MPIKTLPPLQEKWQYHERHVNDIRAALKANKCMDQKNQLRAWHGQRSQDAMEESGHNHLAFKDCCCYPKE